MSNPTSNFNWQMPTATDLVTDLPADFEVFGQAVDTSLADLKGGTSGQILAKNTNTDMDFVWITNDVGDITAVTAGTGISGGGTSGAVTITNSMATEIAAKGDLIAGTGSQTFDNVTVGANDTVLTADSSTATGLKWATPTKPAMVFLTGASFATVSSVSLPTDTFTTTYDIYKVFLMLNASSSATQIQIRMRDAGTDYTGGGYFFGGLNTGYNTGTTTYTTGSAATSWGTNISGNIDRTTMEITIQNPKVGAYVSNAGWMVGMGDLMGASTIAIWQNGKASYDSLTFLKATSGTFSGKYAVYGITNS
jgi:hypothetical protein